MFRGSSSLTVVPPRKLKSETREMFVCDTAELIPSCLWLRALEMSHNCVTFQSGLRKRSWRQRPLKIWHTHFGKFVLLSVTSLFFVFKLVLEYTQANAQRQLIFEMTYFSIVCWRQKNPGTEWMKIYLLWSFSLFVFLHIYLTSSENFSLSERRLNNTDLITVLEAILTASQRR